MDYKVKPIGRTCAASGEKLAPGAECVSVLVESEDGGYARLDFAAERWTGPPEAAVGFWRSTAPESNEPAVRPIDTESMMDYFIQLSEQPNHVEEKFRYVLALSLLQKRRLILEGSREEAGVEYLELVGSHSEGPFEVRDHQLATEEIAAVKSALRAEMATANETATKEAA